jgi:hypothetical protein
MIFYFLIQLFKFHSTNESADNLSSPNIAYYFYIISKLRSSIFPGMKINTLQFNADLVISREHKPDDLIFMRF